MRGNVLALQLWEERSVGTAFGEERSFGTAIRGRREAPVLLFGGGATLQKAKPKQTTHVKLVIQIRTTIIIQFHNKRLLMYKLDYIFKKILT